MFLRVCLGALSSGSQIVDRSYFLHMAILLRIRSTGLRDDLTFLLQEDLSNINLCSLHCEMHDCEQLIILRSLSLFAHRVGSLHALNEALSDHGPESCIGIPRVTVKEKPGQQTEEERCNIKVAFFSGLLTEIISSCIPTNDVLSLYNFISFSKRRLFSLLNQSQIMQ